MRLRALLLAFASLALPAQTLIEPRIVSETLPAGGMMQIKFDFTSPHPITTSGTEFALDFSFDGVEGVSMMSPAGDAYGVAIIQGQSFRANLVSPLASLGTQLDYPFLMVATKIKSGLAPGRQIPINFGSLTFFEGPGGEAYSMPAAKNGVLTIGGSVSITNVVPGGGLLPAGTVVRLLGTGFNRNTKLAFKELTVRDVTYISPTEMQFTLNAAADPSGTQIRARNDDNSEAIYYSYLRAVPVGASGRALLNACHPLFPNGLKSAAGISLGGAPGLGFIAVALRNTTLAATAAQLELISSSGVLLGAVSVTLPAGSQYLRTAQELFGAPPADATIRVTAATPIQVLGLRGDEAAGNVTAFLAGAPPAAGAQLSLSANVVVLDAPSGEKTVNVTSTGAGMSYSVSSSANWLIADPGLGQTPGTVKLTSSTAGLPAGTHMATVQVTPTSGGVAQPVTAVVNVLPANGGSSPVPGLAFPSGGSSSDQTFTFTFTDPNGWQDLDVVNVLINPFLDGRFGCYLAYSRPLNVLYLVNDAGTALLPGLALNGTGTVANSQCTIHGANSSAAGSGKTLALTLRISFPATFGGDRVIYGAARDAVNNSGWKALGTWNIPGGPSPAVGAGGATPASGTGAAQTFTLSFTDTAGWQDLGVVNVLINDSLDGRSACYLAYSRPLQTLYLVNDAGTALLPGMSINGGGTLANGQCAIAGAGASATGSGNTLTLTLPITFTPGFAGNRILYLAARNGAEAGSGWQAKGVRIVP